MGLGLALLGCLALAVTLRGDPSRGRRRCAKCWYSMDGIDATQCPECGRLHRSEAALFRTRRSKRLFTLALCLLAMAQSGWLDARVREGGWLAAVPSEVLILGTPWLPQEWLFSTGNGPERRWTLADRANKGQLAEWQRHWAMDRAEQWVLQAHDVPTVSTRLVLLDRLRWTATGCTGTVSDEVLVHVANCAVQHRNNWDPDEVSYLVYDTVDLRFVRVGDSEHVAASPALKIFSIAHWRELLEMHGNPGLQRAAIYLLAEGDGRPEVMEALCEAVTGSLDHNAFAISNLVWHSDTASDSLADQLLREDLPSRSNIVWSLGMSYVRRPNQRLERILLSDLDSPDPHRALNASYALICREPYAEQAVARATQLLAQRPDGRRLTAQIFKFRPDLAPPDSLSPRVHFLSLPRIPDPSIQATHQDPTPFP